MKHFYHTLIPAVLLQCSVSAQEYTGFANSNYAGISGVDLQPASIVDSRYKVDVNILGANLAFYNNYVAMLGSPTFFISEGLKSRDTTYQGVFQDPDFQDKYLYERISEDRKSVYLNLDVALPSALVTLSSRDAIGFSWRARSITNVDGIEPNLAHQIYSSLMDSTQWYTKLSNKRVSIQTMSWIEYGATYGRVLYEEGEHFLKFGGRVKLLQGLFSAYMFVDDLQYQFDTDDTLSLFQTYADYGHSTNFEYVDNKLKYNFTAKPTFGLDLGVVYEYRPDYEEFKYDMDGETDLWRRDKNKYKLKVGLSILDIGRLKFTKGPLSQSFSADIKDWYIDPVDFESVSDFDDTLNVRFSILDNTGQDYKMSLPTAMSLQVDYNIWKDFYINFTPYLAFKMEKDKNKVHNINIFTLTPRWDYKWFGVFVPVSYDGFKNPAIGLSLRLGPIIAGTRSLGSLGKGQTYGFDAFFALKVPIPYGPPKDRDQDHVSDKMDKCIDTPGVWAFRGCPDTDNDGIQDTEDMCPTVPGPREFKGCPDTDGDGIQDLDDDCPQIPGIEKFKGCPDKDEDGIQDKEDDCPDVPGVPEFNGCPDTDGDGIQDSEDLCPKVPGPKENQGCPDTDGDGLFDYLDECPETPGPRENNGCPYPDTDGDGLLDKDDRCPNNPGPKENDGCPYIDTDGDGVLDKDDNCPNVQGPVENKGCPIIKKEEQEIINTAFDNLEFETGKTIIRDVSFASLRELANLLDKKAEWRLRLAGHTDNVGTEQNNLILSKGRAEAVRDFLVASGISASRIVVEYFGEMRPIATNDTDEGRQKNRRVEMEILFEK